MDPFTLILVCVFAAKMLAEDTYSGITGKPNPRLERRAARRETRANNRTWNAIVDYFGGVAEDAVAQAEKKRARKRQLQDEDWEAEQERRRQQREDEQTRTVDGEYDEVDPRNDQDKPDVWDYDTPDPTPPTCKYGAPVDKNCGWSTCPIHGAINRTEPDAEELELTPDPEPDDQKSDQNTQPHDNYEGAPNMSTDAARGLDPAINYCEQMQSWSAKHGRAGNEGFVNGLVSNGVGEDGGVAAVRHAQQKMAEAAAAWAAASAKLTNSNKAVQEAYRRSQGAGDKNFQNTGS